MRRPVVEGTRVPRYALAPAFALLLAVGACTGAASTGTQENGGTGGPPAAADGDARLRACVEGAGYDWGEVYPPWSSASPPPEGSVFADPAFWQVWQGCVVDAGLSEAGPFNERRIARENREMLAYVACMRSRGWNLPDPEPWAGPEHPGLLDFPDFPLPEDPETRDQYHRDSAECGVPHYDEENNLLPIGG